MGVYGYEVLRLWGFTVVGFTVVGVTVVGELGHIRQIGNMG